VVEAGRDHARTIRAELGIPDLVWMLDGLGIETGVDLASLVATSLWLAAELGREPVSRVVQALG